MKYKESFIKYLQFERRYSVNTIRSYNNDLSQFFQYTAEQYGHQDILKIDHKGIRNWMISLMDNNISARTVNRKITTLKSFCKFLMREGILDASPMDKILTPRQSKKLPEFVEVEKMNELLDTFEFGDDFQGMRNRLIIELLYATGMRRAELIQIADQDFDLQKLTVKVLGKRNKERLIPFTKELKQNIEQYVISRNTFLETSEPDYFFVTDRGQKIYEKFVYRVVRKHLELITTIEKESAYFTSYICNSYVKPGCRS